jgi:predicted O-methyltransferase YrrM
MYDCNDAQPASHYEQVVVKPEPIAADVRRQAFEYMEQLDGWCAKPKAAILIDLILKEKPLTIVEIGVWGGKSLIPMAHALRANSKGKIFGIDPWDNNASIEEVKSETNKTFWSYADHGMVLRGLMQKIEEFDLENQIELIKATSANAPVISEIDILHIDGNHSDKTSYFDVTKWAPLVKKGGWIIFDDMTWFENDVFTTARAVGWLNTNCIKFGEFSDTCVWGIWVKP